MNRCLPLLLALALLPAAAARADDAKAPEPGPWKFGTLLTATVSQSSFSNNWTGGDKGSVVWVLGSQLTLERQFSARFNHQTSLTLAYGQTSRQVVDANGQRTWDSPDKTSDQILLESVNRWSSSTYVNPYLALRAESQFSDQSSPARALSLNPVKLKESAGLARVLRKTDTVEWITRAGFGFRQALGRAVVDGPPIGVKSFSTNDGGFEWQTNIKQPLLQSKVLWTGSLLLFQAVFYSGADALRQYDRNPAQPAGHRAVADDWRALDANAQSTFAAQITNHLGVQLDAQWVYDRFDNATAIDNTIAFAQLSPIIERSVRRGGQFKEVLALAFSYRLF